MLKTEKIGTIEFAGNEIDITDPCYDKDHYEKQEDSHEH